MISRKPITRCEILWRAILCTAIIVIAVTALVAIMHGLGSFLAEADRRKKHEADVKRDYAIYLKNREKIQAIIKADTPKPPPTMMLPVANALS